MEYFDVGYTRVLPWARRPGAAALVAALSAPDRPFDAIVVGEAERAFYDQQYAAMAPLFAQHGVRICPTPAAQSTPRSARWRS